MNCRIFRLGNLTNRFSDGIFQPNYRDNAFLRRIKAFVDAESMPKLLADEHIEMTPVDLAAKAIVMLSEYADDKHTVFHISNDKNAVTYERVAALFSDNGVNMSFVDTDMFIEKIKSHESSENSSLLNEMNEMGMVSNKVKVVTDSSFTAGVLSNIGFNWESISDIYIKKYIEHFKRLNYFI